MMREALGSVVSGVLVGIMAVVFATSYSSIIFSGDLAAHVHVGIGITLFSAAAMATIVALSSSYPGSVALPQDIGSAVFAIAAASIAAGIATGANPERLLPTILAALVLTSLVTGALLLLLGMFRLGGLVRYIPYPVIGGFLAASGWLLFTAAISLMSDIDIGWTSIPALVDGFATWVPGLALGLVLLVVTRILKHPLTLPGCLILAILIFHLGLIATGMTSVDAQSSGLLLAPLSEGESWRPVSPALFWHADWSQVLAQSSTIGTIAMLSAIGLLLNVSAIEVTAKRDLDIDRELVGVGTANLVCAAGGGMTGFHYLSLTSLSHRMGGTSRLVGLMAAAICVGALFFGGALLAYLPKMLLGAVVAFLGMEFMIEWLVQSRRKLPMGDYLVIVLIFVVAGLVGFLEAIGVGILASSVLFLVNYSRLGVVRHAISGAEYHSNVARPEGIMQILREKGDCVFLLKLSGYVFFGTANRVVEIVQQRNQQTGRLLRFVVLDFSAVIGVDSSAATSLTKLYQQGLQNGWTLVLTTISQDLETRFRACGFDTRDRAGLRKFAELDRGVEWCEAQIIAEEGADEDAQIGLMDYLRGEFPAAAPVDQFMAYLERIDAEPRDRIMGQGDDTRDLYFIDSGKVSVELEMDGDATIRLLTIDHGTVGEVGFYTELPRSATVTAEAPSRVYRLTRARLAEMESENPRLASALHAYVARRLGYRLADTSNVLRAMLR